MMRFGHFFYPMNFDAARDYQVITDCLAEAELVEHLGLDAIWIAEHHFTGETVYGDAVVFAAALAMKTQHILLGLRVVEMALHNPVQLAIQTALLDNRLPAPGGSAHRAAPSQWRPESHADQSRPAHASADAGLTPPVE
jgi:hypothetical protein